MRIELLVRLRLLRSLQAALHSGHVLITAPAGYGKTMLLRSLAAHRPYTFYLPLAPADADLPHLQERLEEALQTACLQPQTTLLLDDVHHLEEGPEALNWLLEQLQHDAPRLVLAGRWVPGPAVCDRVTKGELAHLDADDLAFTLAESWAFLERHYIDTPELAAAWHERTGGWPLALALLARVRTAPDPRPVAEAELFTYLARTLAQGLPPELLHFWTLTAVPRRFNDDLAAVLLGAGGNPVALRQEIEHHNLFLERAEKPGWFQYHELIREFLLQQATEDLTPVFQQVIAWFEAHDDLEMAIEHALAAGLEETAAQLIEQVPARFVREMGRIRTYRRWILSLGQQTRTAHPTLLSDLGLQVHSIGWREEGWAYLNEGLRLAEDSADPIARLRALAGIARAQQMEGDYETALALCRRILDDPTCGEFMRLHTLLLAGTVYLRLARFRQARTVYREALALAEAMGREDMQAMIRHNLAVYALLPLGKFEAGRTLLMANDAYATMERPNFRIVHLWGWSELHRATGSWDALAQALAEIKTLFARVEASAVSDEFWWWWYEGMRAIGQGDLDRAQMALNQAAGRTEDRPETLVCLAWAQTWLSRRQGHFQEAVQRAEDILARPLESPFYRAVLALERDIANHLRFRTLRLGSGQVSGFGPGNEASTQNPDLHPETGNLIRMRPRPHLVQLRALLALRAWQKGEQRWRRHFQAALYALSRPGCEHLLTHYDADLGSHFWTLGLMTGTAVAQAMAALRAIGNPESVSPLLGCQAPSVRIRAAQALAAIGREETMPALAAALSTEGDERAAAAMEVALAHLESLPPPLLKVKLMGDFALWRGGQPVPDEAWQRPIVRRLFQYFALHRGLPLSRDRILDDLWPQSDPQRARAIFHTVHSRLRHVLEPYMRPRSPCRYMAVQGEVYCFDPRGVVHVDVEAFEATVQQTLRTADEQDMPPLPEDLLAALERWEPLLPELPYEEWLLEPRERLHELYVEGCLYVAQSLLIYGHAGEAIDWARRTVQAAPWLEEGYQALMRAYARRGQRALALRTYSEAVEALKRELDVEPSPLTRWLAARLKRGEEI